MRKVGDNYLFQGLQRELFPIGGFCIPGLKLVLKFKFSRSGYRKKIRHLFFIPVRCLITGTFIFITKGLML